MPPTQRILIVDDEPGNREILSRLLAWQGHDIVCAKDGVEALEHVFAAASSFDLVMLDLMMPGINGYDVLKKIRERLSPVELPVIIITALSDTSETVRCLEAGANDHITRPIDSRVTLARIAAQLKVKEGGLAQTGNFHKLSGSSHTLPRLMGLCCPDCLSALSRSASHCSWCANPKPEVGWTIVKGSPWPYLGRTVGGRYFLSRFILHGSSGQVYQAQDTDLERDFAIKIINIATLHHDLDTLRERLLLEIKALAQVDNPHVLKMYQVVHLSDDIWGIVTDFCRGQNLLQVLDAEPSGYLPPHDAVEILLQVITALHEVHAIGILHGDIKPANIMSERLSTGARFVRVLDFGIAQFINQPHEGETMLGTPDYMAPEVIMGDWPVDVRTDIYGLGATFFHMLTGKPPYSGESSQVLRHHLLTPIPPLPNRLNRFAPLLTKMMAKEPDDRHQNLDALLLELVAVRD